jgi:hypothetical protein
LTPCGFWKNKILAFFSGSKEALASNAARGVKIVSDSIY